MIEWSKKMNSTERCDRAWHSTTTHRPSCLYPNARALVVGERRQVIAGSRPLRKLSALQSRSLPPSEHSALGCRSEMSVSIAMRSVGYMRVAIIRFGATCPVKRLGNVRLRRAMGIRGTNCGRYSEAAGLAAAGLNALSGSAEKADTQCLGKIAEGPPRRKLLPNKLSVLRLAPCQRARERLGEC